MVLKPEKVQELQQNNNFSDSSVLMFTAQVVQLLVGFLVDENISVVEATSAALYKVLATQEGQQIIGKLSGKETSNVGNRERRDVQSICLEMDVQRVQN